MLPFKNIVKNIQEIMVENGQQKILDFIFKLFMANKSLKAVLNK
jgi:hypothetical protein